MSLSKNQLAIIGVVLGLIIIITLLVLGVIPGLRSTSNSNGLTGKLTIWGVEDTEDEFAPLITQYNITNPGVEITYRQMDEANYESNLINALAAGTGPDIFMFKNSWLPKHFDKVAPTSLTQVPLDTFREYFPTIAEQNFVAGGNIYAMPLFSDSLVMFYNKDLFDTAGIAQPPQTWEQLIAMIPKLRQLDTTGKIARAAVALGGSIKSIHNASDILSLIMLQNGVQMIDDQFTEATYARTGTESLRFYTNFANPIQSSYSWSNGFGNSIDSFAQEKTAIIFDYGRNLALIKEKNPFLNIGFAPMLQKTDAPKSINYADYWGLTVSKKSTNRTLAWDFVFAATTNSAANSAYLTATEKSPMIRSLIATAQTKAGLTGILARQTLTARGWSQIDNNAITTSFSQAIDAVVSGQASADKALKTSEEAISDLIRIKASANQNN